MPPAPYRMQVIIPAFSGVTADSCVNTWGVEAPDENLDWWPTWKASVKTFYDSWSTYRPTTFLWANTTTKLYNMEDTKPRVPLKDESLGLVGAGVSSALPTEVALCLSFQGQRTSGLPQRRRRGRIYLGPFSANANTTTNGRPLGALQTIIRDAALVLLNAHNGGVGTAQWVVISQADTPGMQTVYVTDGWVDDAWDTQRRRGVKPSLRMTFVGT
jgi:hypothetical protein